jgi:hypothetical protein
MSHFYSFPWIFVIFFEFFSFGTKIGLFYAVTAHFCVYLLHELKVGAF